MGGGLILAVKGGTIAGVSRALRELIDRHVLAGTIPGGVALWGAGTAEVVTAGVASIGGGPMGEDAIMRIQSMTKAVTSVAALRLVEAGRLELDQSLADWLPELADRQVLRGPTAELDDTVPARRAITLRHLLTNTSGYGTVIQASPLQRAMAANGTEAGPEPPTMGADEWLRRLAELPLAFQPGEGWRYHHSFAVLGILISRVTGRPLGEHLAEDVFWDGMGWGFGVAVKTAGPQRGRIGWSGGLGTDFFVDPDGTVGILLTQVEMGEDMSPLVDQFQSLHET